MCASPAGSGTNASTAEGDSGINTEHADGVKLILSLGEVAPSSASVSFSFQTIIVVFKPNLQVKSCQMEHT